MFYPVHIDISDSSRVQQATVVLNPAESKRLLARTVAELPEVQNAFKNCRLSVSTCSTSAFVLEELTGEKIAPHCYCIGMVADGMLTASSKDDRETVRFFLRGERVDEEARTFLGAFDTGDVAIKGANAVDPHGNAGVLVSNDVGGTIGALMSRVAVRGLPVIMPVGLEKMIPCVEEAAAGWGQLTLTRSMGNKVWLFPFSPGLVMTEIQALGVSAGVKVRYIASGGIGGSEGAVVLLLEGYEQNLTKAWELVEAVKGEPPVGVPRHQYSC